MTKTRAELPPLVEPRTTFEFLLGDEMAAAIEMMLVDPRTTSEFLLGPEMAVTVEIMPVFRWMTGVEMKSLAVKTLSIKMMMPETLSFVAIKTAMPVFIARIIIHQINSDAQVISIIVRIFVLVILCVTVIFDIMGGRARTAA